VTIAGYLTRTC